MYQDVELYVSGINPVDVMGADPLPGDWDVEGLNFTEAEAEEPEAEEADEEPDYDESGEDLNDDQ